MRRLWKAPAMEGNRLVHHEQRLSALFFVHAHVGSGKQVSQGDKRGIHASPEVSRRGLKVRIHDQHLQSLEHDP